MTDEQRKWILDVALVECKTKEKNKSKGLIPRFHQDLSDRFYGGTKASLGKICNEMAEAGELVKSFIKFSPSSNDKIENDTVVEGSHNGMKVGKDGKLSTPIYWKTGDTDIPDWSKQNDRVTNYRLGQSEFGANRNSLV